MTKASNDSNKCCWLRMSTFRAVKGSTREYLDRSGAEGGKGKEGRGRREGEGGKGKNRTGKNNTGKNGEDEERT